MKSVRGKPVEGRRGARALLSTRDYGTKAETAWI
jgi:hypothetical protein